MTDDLARRLAEALGWSVNDVRGFSVQALRDLVRPVAPGLAEQLTQEIQSGRYVRGPL